MHQSCARAMACRRSATASRMVLLTGQQPTFLPMRVAACLQATQPPIFVFNSKSNNNGCLSNNYFSTAAATSNSKIAVPPNLRFDPRSSYAPAKERMNNRPVAPSPPQDDNEEKSSSEDSVNEKYNEYDDDIDDELFLTTDEIKYAVPLPERLHVDIHTLFAPEHSSQVGTLWLDEGVFGRDPVRVDLLKRSVNYYRNKKRGRRKAVTKTIGQIKRSGRKLRQQKGTGQARMGHGKAPHLRGGAKAHGPKNVTDYGNTKLNKKVRRLAVCHALSQKLLEGNLIVLNALHELPTHKTKELVRLLEPWGIAGKDGTSALILDSYEEGEQQQESFAGVPVNLWVASRNVPKIRVGNEHAANVYDILKHEKLVLTLAVVEKLEERLSYLD